MSDFAAVVRSYQAGDLQAARRSGRSFLRREPGHKEALLLLSLVHVALGEGAEAEPLLKRLLAYKPQHAGANYLLGNLLRERGELQAAMPLYEQSLASAPQVAETWINFGLCHYDQHHAQDALECFDKALQLQAEHPLALYNTGNALQALGRPTEAIVHYQRALRQQPNDWRLHYNMGNALLAAGQPTDALACFDRVLVINPEMSEAHANAGVALRRLGHPGGAVERLRLALARSADSAPILHTLANAQSDLGQHTLAVQTLRELLAAHPHDIEARFNLALALHETKDLAAASEQFAQIIAQDPTNPRYLGGAISTAWACWDMSRVDALWPLFEASWKDGALAPVELWARRLDDPKRIAEAAKHTMQHLLAEQAFDLEPQPDRPVRISAADGICRLAYLSPDFGEHPVGYSMVELLEQHDRSHFSVMGISLGQRPQSAIGDRLQVACDEFIDAAAMSSPDIARLLRDRGIDVAIDLAGYTAGGRPMILSARPAAVQVGYLGFPSTSGAPWLDYLLVDPIVAPAADAAWYSEQLVHLPHSFFPSDSRASALDVQVSRRDEQLPEQGFVYACFNTPERISQAMFSLWMTILSAQPDSVLWLRAAAPLAVHNLRASAAAQGVNPDRLVFAGFSPNRTQHLARHRLADLYLDTFPYNSHSTARDALQSGLPVLTLSGRSFASRVAASLLQALQLPQLIATNTQDYVDRAVALASAPVRVAELKAQLQQAIATTTLFDSKTLASHVETAYQHMLDRHRRGLPPQSFAVPASPQGY